tara:strand:+ start:131 stop:1294 length:1164 start_codon:yes stop_codon:yes gene_type:complete
MKFDKNIQDLIPEMKKWRQKIHSVPEIAYEEYKTSEFIEKKLKQFGIKVFKNFGKTGLVGILEGTKKSNKSIGLRADMDALPMDEKTNLSYSSKNLGKMHACGHDGHITMLLGAAKILAKDKNFAGKVYFIFQPAEEGGRAGAKSMITDGLFEKFKIDNVWGIHNWPGVELGKAVIHKKFAMAGGDIFEINIMGKGGHAAQPNVSNDPIIALGFIIVSLQTIISRQLDPFSNAVLSITKINSGSAFNVIPEIAYLGGTLRSTNKHERKDLLTKIKNLTEQTAITHNCKVDFNINPGYPPTVNDEKSANFAYKVYEKYFGKSMIDENCTPTMGSEDFSYMLMEKPGAYIWLGAGIDSEKLHSPYFDFNDKLLPFGVKYWECLVKENLI